MNITFLIGNGFDIAIGLNTSYQSFYKWYLEQDDESEDIAFLKDHIRGHEKTTWADFEIALGQFTSKFDNAERFIKCFQYVRASLMDYLKMVYEEKKKEKDFLKSATYCLIEFSQNLNKDLKNKDYFSVSKDCEMIFNCLSFNYTPVFRDGKNELEQNSYGISSRDGWYNNYKLGEFMNVHGLIDNNPIVGVDNVTQIANESFRTNKKIVNMMVKGEYDKQIRAGWREKAYNIIQNSDEIYIYGMSLGETDMFWWKTIAEWFEKDLINHKLVIYCHPDDDNKMLLAKTNTALENIRKHLKDKDYITSIEIDNIEKKLIVAFVRLQYHSIIRTDAKAYLDVIKAK